MYRHQRVADPPPRLASMELKFTPVSVEKPASKQTEMTQDDHAKLKGEQLPKLLAILDEVLTKLKDNGKSAIATYTDLKQQTGTEGNRMEISKFVFGRLAQLTENHGWKMKYLVSHMMEISGKRYTHAIASQKAVVSLAMEYLGTLIRHIGNDQTVDATSAAPEDEGKKQELTNALERAQQTLHAALAEAESFKEQVEELEMKLAARLSMESPTSSNDVTTLQAKCASLQEMVDSLTVENTRPKSTKEEPHSAQTHNEGPSQLQFDTEGLRSENERLHQAYTQLSQDYTHLRYNIEELHKDNQRKDIILDGSVKEIARLQDLLKTSVETAKINAETTSKAVASTALLVETQATFEQAIVKVIGNNRPFVLPARTKRIGRAPTPQITQGSESAHLDSVEVERLRAALE